MQTPYRKAGKYTGVKPDPHITQEKYDQLAADLEKLKKVKQPRAIEEVQRLALMGDFSENAAYQIAKGRLRGINQRILDIEDHLKRSVIIQAPSRSDIIGLGHIIAVEVNGAERTYQILGSSETDPGRGVISHNSPIGAALLGRHVGETITVKLTNKELTIRIKSIS